MPNLTAERDVKPWMRRLYLPAYQIKEAARYARIARQTVSSWHYRRLAESGLTTLPERERGRPLSYLELVEVAIVAVFRSFGVPLKNIAETRAYMAQNFNSEFPFAQYRFRTDGYHLLMRLQEIDPNIDIQSLIVADAGGQLGWESMMEDRLYEFDYEYDIAIKWHLAGRHSPVLIDPRVAFGAPMVRGVPTWTLKGRWNAGETVSDIQEDFSLTAEEIKAALDFEGISLSA